MAFWVGPGAAFLHESGSSFLGSMGGFWSIGRVVLLAGLGLGVGLRSATRSPRWLGYLAVMSNGLVVLLYGFLLVFFGLGGSR